MKKIYTVRLFLVTALLALTISINAQTTGDYRTRNNGNWNNTGTWSRYNGTTWVNATDYPGQNTSPAEVIIRNNHTVTLNVSPSNSIGSILFETGSQDAYLNFNSGQTLNVSGAITMEGGTGSGDNRRLEVGASTLNCGSLTMQDPGSTNRYCRMRISTGTVTVSGDITMNGNATNNYIEFTGAGTLNVGGSIAAGGDIVPFSTTSGLVNYNGTSGTQTVKADTYADITFSGGAAKSIATGGIIITDVATFTSGIVSSSSANSVTFNNNATATGASDASFVNGPVTKIGNDAFTFPVGKTGTGYQAISMSAPSSTGDAFTAEYMRASGATLGPKTAVGLISVSNCEYWDLNRTAGTSSVNVTLNWNANSPCGGSYITGLIGLVVAYFDGANWSDFGGNGTSGNVTAGTVVHNGVSAFGSFTIGNVLIGGSPLPVKLSNIKAFEKQQGIQLDWTAYQEDNLNNYQIERSADGINFTPLGTVAARNLTSATDYTFFDATPVNGVNFYRIKNIDLDGKSGYSNVVKVNLDKNVKGFSLYPNPVRNGMVSYQSSDLSKGNYAVNIFNANGQQVYTQRFNHAGGSINQTIQLPVGVRSGMYTLQLDNGNLKVMSKVFMVQ